MYLNILSDKQAVLLPFIRKFNKHFYLAGGTAIALQIGHPKSIDFDLYSNSILNKKKIHSEIQQLQESVQPLYFDDDQQHYLVGEGKCTFLYYPYAIQHNYSLKNVISMPDLLDLAAMKAFALGRRSKWKDYVDMYFILKNHYSLTQITEKAKEYFPDQVTEKLLRNQLAFHDDIDFQERVDYVIENPPTEQAIKDFLIEVATRLF